MTIEISKETRLQVIASIERDFRENMDAPIGNVSADAQQGFLIEKIDPCLYNQSVVGAQERMLARMYAGSVMAYLTAQCI